MLPTYQHGQAEAFIQRQQWAYKHSGDELILKACPFCGRQDYRFYLNNATGAYVCHHASCGEKGGWYKFSRAFGGPVVKPAAAYVPPPPKRWNISTFAHREQHLANDPEILAYLQSRNISLETAQAWHLGSKEKPDGSKWLMIPYLSYSGEIVDVKSRNIRQKEFERVKGGESILFGEHLFPSYHRPKVLYFAEGEIDAISLWQAGFRPVVSSTTGAKGFLPRYYDLIVQKLQPESIVIVYDSDIAGQEGAKELLQKFNERDREVRNIVLPVKDANEYFLTHTPQDFEALVKASEPKELERVLSISTVLDMLETQLFMGESGCDGYPSQFPDLNKMIAGGYWKGTVSTLSGVAGCHAKGQGILMYDGSIKRVEDVTFGDQLMGPDSTPRTVLALVRGIDKMVDVVPVKGSTWRVNSDHILTLKRSYGHGPDLVDVSVREWLSWSQGRRAEYKLWRTGVEQFGGDQQPFPLRPYVVGVMLGDGHLSSGTSSPSFSTVDPEILFDMQAEADRFGLQLVKVGTNAEDCVYSLTGGPTAKAKRYSNGFKQAMRDIGLWPQTCETKHVPLQYLRASRLDRLDLLAGLIDTDGSVGRNGTSVDFISKSSQLAQDVAFLARSLGFAAYIAPCEKSCQTGARGRYYRVSLSGDLSAIPTRIARKRLLKRRQIKSVNVTGFSVVETKEYQHYYGFMLDGDRRYLLDDFTVTHNCGKTSFVLQELLEFSKQGVPSYLLCLEMPETMVMRKIIEHVYRIPMLKQTLADVQNVRHELEALPMYLGYKGGNWAEIEKAVRLAHKRYGLKVLAFDNVNYFVRSVQHQASEIGLVTKRLKELAVELQLAVLLIAQPRKFDDADRMMNINDLKDSSSIGQDSDNVMMLWRRRLETKVKKDELPPSGFIGAHSPLAILRVDKSRFSAGGEMVLYFNGAISTYRELTESERQSLSHATENQSGSH